jgi:hypothetical protein
MNRNQKRTAKTVKRNRKSRWQERPTDLLLWVRNGSCLRYQARVAADTEVSIGRTDSKRALGFAVHRGGANVVDFVLDKDQVAELAAYLRVMQPALLKPLGRKQDQMSLAAMSLPKQRLFNRLESAATEAHPGWHRIDDATIEQDEGAPGGNPRKTRRENRNGEVHLSTSRCSAPSDTSSRDDPLPQPRPAQHYDAHRLEWVSRLLWLSERPAQFRCVPMWLATGLRRTLRVERACQMVRHATQAGEALSRVRRPRGGTAPIALKASAAAPHIVPAEMRRIGNGTDRLSARASRKTVGGRIRAAGQGASADFSHY